MTNFTFRGDLSKFATMFLGVATLSGCATPGTGGAQSNAAMGEIEILAAAKTIHQESLVLDAHADIALPSTSALYLGADGTSKVAPQKLRTGGVGAVVMSVAVGPGPRTKSGDAEARAEADQKLTAAHAMAKASNFITIAKSPDAIEKAKRDGIIAIILGFQNARSLEGNVAALDHFYSAGIRVFGLNHLGHNDFSDSSRPVYIAEKKAYEITEEHGGLSPLGKTAIRRINKLGGIVDVSQLSKAAALQTINLSKAPVIASHSNVRSLSNVTRNLSDEEIDRIGETGGVVHLAPFGAYLVDLSNPRLLAAIKAVRLKAGLPEAYSYPYELYWEIDDPEEKVKFLQSMRAVIGRGNVGRLIDHIDYVVKRIGIDHVGIGTDFNHGGGVEGFDEASEALNVTIGLLKRGYSAEDIDKIWGSNFLRVFREVERIAGETVTDP